MFFSEQLGHGDLIKNDITFKKHKNDNKRFRHKIVNKRLYTVLIHKEEKLLQEIYTMEFVDIIEPSTSEFLSTIVLIP